MKCTRYSIPLAALIAIAIPMIPTAAKAGNGLHPRTPVDWSGAPCMTIIDRSQTTIFALEYTIPYEDTDVTPDEVDDSRTHQFFAFCRDHHREEIIPGWITEADLIDSDAHGLGDAELVDAELNVLENAPQWADCWVRISDDDERRPITFAAAAEPIMWDTMALPAGTWVIEGYTYEPWTNAWWPHPGVFKIIDDPDPAASGPAAALTFPEQIVEYGDEATISGCVDAMDGATMTASWALGGFGTEPVWMEFASDLDVQSGSFELAFAPPIETVSSTVLIKVEVSDPIGRSWTAHAIADIGVTEDFGDDGCDDGGGFVSDPCGTEDGGETGDPGETGESGGAGSSGDSSDTGDSSGEGTSSGALDGADGGGCNCSIGPGTGPGSGRALGGRGSLWLLGLGLWLGLRLGLGRRRQISRR